MADEHVSIAEAKARFSALVSSVLHRRQRIVIGRHGKSVAALDSLEDSDDDGVEGATTDRPMGLLAAVGSWHDVPDEEINAFLEDVYRERRRDLGRPVHSRRVRYLFDTDTVSNLLRHAPSPFLRSSPGLDPR